MTLNLNIVKIEINMYKYFYSKYGGVFVSKNTSKSTSINMKLNLNDKYVEVGMTCEETNELLTR